MRYLRQAIYWAHVLISHSSRIAVYCGLLSLPISIISSFIHAITISQTMGLLSASMSTAAFVYIILCITNIDQYSKQKIKTIKILERYQNKSYCEHLNGQLIAAIIDGIQDNLFIDSIKAINDSEYYITVIYPKWEYFIFYDYVTCMISIPMPMPDPIIVVHNHNHPIPAVVIDIYQGDIIAQIIKLCKSD